LLTVVKHELGHVIGMDHDDHGLMAPVLASGASAVGSDSLAGLHDRWDVASEEARHDVSGIPAQARSAEGQLQESAVDRALAESLLDDLRVTVADDDEEVLEDLVRRTSNEQEVDTLFAVFAAD